MKLLKLVTIFSLVMFAAVVIRAGVRKFTPGLYVAIWGGTIVEKQEQESSIGTVMPETRKEENTSTVPATPVSPTPEPEIFATGRVRYGKRVLVQFSDGSVRTHEDNDTRARLTRVTSTYADFDGKRYYFKSSASAGSGVSVTPVRPDTEVPGVAVPAVTGPERTADISSAGPAASTETRTPPHQQQGSWVVGSDGVQRLRESSSLSSALGR